MRYCRVPTVSVSRLKAKGIEPTADILLALLNHCIQVGSTEHRPWVFDQACQVPIGIEADPLHMERLLMTWAMQTKVDFSWLDQIPKPRITSMASGTAAAPAKSKRAKRSRVERAPIEQQPAKNEVQSVVAALVPVDTYDFEWREVQQFMFERLEWMRDDAIATLEASTGSGKTRVAARWICNRLHDGGAPFIVAVPTVALATQWVSEFAQIDRNVDVLPVLGKQHYPTAKHQEQALEAAMHAKLVICTQHMLLTLMAMKKWRLVVDEGHLLAWAIKASAGFYLPVQALGEGFKSWCTGKLGLIEGQAMEVPLMGKVRSMVIKKLKVQPEQVDGVSVVVDADGGMGVMANSKAAVKAALARLWSACSCALLLSATESSVSSAGVRSIHLFSRRLAIPEGRLQDLGQIKSRWRDAGVKVLMPERKKASDGSLWLTPSKKRTSAWYDEIAQVLAGWSVGRKKTLVLATSYADVQGLKEAVAALGVSGVFSPGRETPISEQRLAFASSAVWCWVATGTAWTGMDLPVPIARLAVSKLPLLHPEAMDADALPEEVVHDCVSRFRQGLGRMVRAEGFEERELVLLDGRVNESAPWWRGVCHPYLQVLAEDYEDFERLAATVVE